MPKKPLKIISTAFMFPSYDEYVDIIKLYIELNIDTLRFNMTRYEPGRYINDISIMKDIYLKESKGKELKLILDMPIPKIKPRALINGEDFVVEIKKGEKIVLCKNQDDIDISKRLIYIDDSELFDKLARRQAKRLFFDDGKFVCETKNITDNFIEMLALNSGQMGFYKSVYLENHFFSELTDVEIINEYIRAIEELQPEYVALSFIEESEQITNFINKVSKKTSYPVNYIAKIETQRAIDNLHDIFLTADTIMLGRGDLAINSDYAMLGYYQELVINECNKANKPIFICTDILSSIVNNKIPNRAELIDIYTIIKSNVDGIITSGKIGMGKGLKEFCDIANSVSNNMESINNTISEKEG